LTKLIAALKVVVADREKWVRLSNPRHRAKISREDETIADELAAIATDTETKEVQGQTVYLLHRGMSDPEFAQYKKDTPEEYGVIEKATSPVKYRRNSSWSTDIEIAFGFAHANADHSEGVLVSAWIFEDAILARLDKEHHHYSETEKEVIVGKGLVTSDFSYRRGLTERERWAPMAIRNLKKVLKEHPDASHVKEQLDYLENFVKKFYKKKTSASRVVAEDDYKGEHAAPDKESGIAMHEIEPDYLKDIASIEQGSQEASGIAASAYGNPKARIKIYRAVPKSASDMIGEYEKQKAYIMKYGKVPSYVDTPKHKSDYYDEISDKLEELEANPPQAEKLKINPGDWVTITKAYAVEHGRSNLNNLYKIITKTVAAKDLYTESNSIFEWGYDP